MDLASYRQPVLDTLYSHVLFTLSSLLSLFNSNWMKRLSLTDMVDGEGFELIDHFQMNASIFLFGKRGSYFIYLLNKPNISFSRVKLLASNWSKPSESAPTNHSTWI